MFIKLHELGDAGALGVEPAPEAVGLHDSLVVLLMSAPQLRRHDDLIVEGGKAALGIQRPRVQYGLRGLLDLRSLLLRGCRPREVIIANRV